MKKLLSIVIIIVLALTLASCTDTKTYELSDYISSEPLKLTGIKLEGEVQSLSAYKNIAFMLCDGNITRLDLLNKNSQVILEDSTALAIACDGSQLVTVSPSQVCVYDYDGALLTSIPIETEISEIIDVAIDKECVVLAHRAKSADEIYCADLNEMTLSLLPSGWNVGVKNAQISKLSLSSSGTLLVSYRHNFSMAGYDVRVVQYSIENNAVSSYLDVSAVADNGCFDNNGELYYIDTYYTDHSIWNQFITKESSDGTSSNIMLVDNEGLKAIGIEPQEIFTHDHENIDGTITTQTVLDDYSLEYADGENFVVWNKTANTLAAFSANTEVAPLVLLTSDAVGEIEFWLKSLIIEYTAQTGRQVVIKSYHEGDYESSVRTKLLAQDTDFDLFIADTALLRSVLENSAYESLDAYEGLSANFDNVLADGVRELMSTDEGLFGVPLTVSFWGCLELVEEADIPKDWSLQDMFSVCESLEGGDKKLLRDRFMLTRTVCNYVEDMVQKDGAVNEEELSEFFATLKKYNDTGVLCDGDKEYVLTYGLVPYNYGTLNANDFEGSIMVLAPTRSGTRYLEVEKTMLINRSSESKEVAAELLTLMTSEDVVYDNECLMIGADVTKYTYYASLDDAKQEMIEFTSKTYQNAKPSFLGIIDGLPQFIADEVMNPLFDGEITPEEAAEKLKSHVAYVYFE
ncbi:MAG: extracellular solute-binding protein [Oscillospiraceae bacterium]|nr:extracellular solute-binding protein [Oscillospiraceae bacterium]